MRRDSKLNIVHIWHRDIYDGLVHRHSNGVLIALERNAIAIYNILRAVLHTRKRALCIARIDKLWAYTSHKLLESHLVTLRNGTVVRHLCLDEEVEVGSSRLLEILRVDDICHIRHVLIRWDILHGATMVGDVRHLEVEHIENLLILKDAHTQRLLHTRVLDGDRCETLLVDVAGLDV